MTHFSSGPMGLTDYGHSTNTSTSNTPRSSSQLKRRKMISFPSLMFVSARKEEDYWLQCIGRPPTPTGTSLTTHITGHPRTTMGVLRCMRDRAYSICRPTKMQQEMDHLNQVFQVNGFPENLSKEDPNDPPTAIPGNFGTTTNGRSTQDTVHPLHQGAKQEDGKGLCPSGSKACFQTKKCLKRELMQVKYRTPEQKRTGVAYEIPFKDCAEVYMGETKRTLKVGLSEHRQAVNRGDHKNSIAVHVQKTNHCINWEGTTVQRRAEGFWLRTVEAIQIKKATQNMNLNSGLFLPMIWKPILNPHPLPHT